MGSFNETCALSRLPITYGDPVKLLFLTRNPYSTTCDEHFAKRGCYHTDQWYVRTPPISGNYNDYGRCDFEESYLTKLIEKTFATDVIDLPFGYNEYHAPPVCAAESNIHNYLEAAWEGRLLVADGYRYREEKVPDNFPTWHKVHTLLKNAKFPIMKKEGDKAYNAQQVQRGIVTVYWNEYSNYEKRLNKIVPLLSEHYDVRRHDFSNEHVLVVVPKGGFDDHSLFFDPEKIRSALEHPRSENTPTFHPVLAVMIRQDIWDLYKNAKYQSPWRDETFTLDEFKEKTKKLLDLSVEIKNLDVSLDIKDENLTVEELQAKIKDTLIQLRKLEAMQEIVVTNSSIPFQTSISSHLKQIPALDPQPTPVEIQELADVCAELARVEMIMANTNNSWHIPPTSGQETQWELQKAINSGIAKIAQAAKKEEEEEQD